MSRAIVLDDGAMLTGGLGNDDCSATDADVPSRRESQPSRTQLIIDRVVAGLIVMAIYTILQRLI